jgi:hypothetical protein
MLTVLRFICYVAHTPATLCASEIGNGPMKILEAECEERKRMPLERSIFEVGSSLYEEEGSGYVFLR